MCQFLSAIVTKHRKRVHWHPMLDHHSDLLEWMAASGRGDFTKDDAPDGHQKFARVEFTPDGHAYDHPESYTLRLDEHREPEWWDAALAEDVAGQLRDVIRGMIVNDERPLLLGDAWIIGPTGKVKKVLAGTRVLAMFGTSSVGKMLGTSSVGKMLDTSCVGKMLGTSSVGEMLGASSVGEMLGASSVGEMLGTSSVGEMWGTSSVGKMLGTSSVGEMWDTSSVGEMLGTSSVGEMWGTSTSPIDPRADNRTKVDP